MSDVEAAPERDDELEVEKWLGWMVGYNEGLKRQGLLNLRDAFQRLQRENEELRAEVDVLWRERLASWRR